MSRLGLNPGPSDKKPNVRDKGPSADACGYGGTEQENISSSNDPADQYKTNHDPD
jgi:hypothetical protein